MFMYKIKEVTIDKFIIKKPRREHSGYMQKLTSRFSRSHTVWEGENFKFVFPYGFLLSLALFLIMSLLIKFYLRPSEVNWFRSSLDLVVMLGTFIFYTTHMQNGKNEEELSTAVDTWWTYTYLEKETQEFKKNIEQSMDFVTGLLINLSYIAGIGFVMLPVFKYIINGGNDIADLLVVNSLHDVPWVYLEIISGTLTFATICSNGGQFVANMAAMTFIHNTQLQLAGVAFSTIEDRVTRMMKNTFHVADETFELLVQNEIKSCSRNYQAIYRQTKQLYKITKAVLNFGVYFGGCCIISFVVMEKENIFLMMQLGGFMLAFLQALFLLCYPIESLINEVESFRLQVYGSAWYNFPLPCQRSVYIMQTMLMHAPKYNTLLGAKVSLEFFGKLLNASYCYITTILSMSS